MHFGAGFYARMVMEQGVARVPANEPLRSTMRMEAALTQAQIEALGPEGVNCLREFRTRACGYGAPIPSALTRNGST